MGLVQLKIHEADDEVPVLPPKDLIVSVTSPQPWHLVRSISYCLFEISVSGREETLARPAVSIADHPIPLAPDLPRRPLLIRQDALQEVLLPLHVPRGTQRYLGGVSPRHISQRQLHPRLGYLDAGEGRGGLDPTTDPH